MDIILLRNKKTYNGKFKTILIDRTTIFGNPFKIKEYQDRNTCIERYANMVKKELMNDRHNSIDFFSMFKFLENEMYEAVKRNEPLILLCHCYPKRCHGDIIKQILLNKYYHNYWFIREVCECCGNSKYEIGVYGL